LLSQVFKEMFYFLNQDFISNTLLSYQLSKSI
jgi:hypothetical protein